jgi:hypothetical protein
VPFRLGRGDPFYHYDTAEVEGPLGPVVRSDTPYPDRANSHSQRRLRETINSNDLVYFEANHPSEELVRLSVEMSSDVIDL